MAADSDPHGTQRRQHVGNGPPPTESSTSYPTDSWDRTSGPAYSAGPTGPWAQQDGTRTAAAHRRVAATHGEKPPSVRVSASGSPAAPARRTPARFATPVATRRRKTLRATSETKLDVGGGRRGSGGGRRRRERWCVLRREERGRSVSG
ncbi:unnamed protein product [Urochloa humidicola]